MTVQMDCPPASRTNHIYIHIFQTITIDISETLAMPIPPGRDGMTFDQ